MREPMRSGTRSGETDRTGYSAAGVSACRSDEVTGFGACTVGACTSSSKTTRGAMGTVPVRILEGSICSNPCVFATCSMLLKYCFIGRARVSKRHFLPVADVSEDQRAGEEKQMIHTLTVFTCSSRVASSSHTIIG